MRYPLQFACLGTGNHQHVVRPTHPLLATRFAGTCLTCLQASRERRPSADLVFPRLAAVKRALYSHSVYRVSVHSSGCSSTVRTGTRAQSTSCSFRASADAGEPSSSRSHGRFAKLLGLPSLGPPSPGEGLRWGPVLGPPCHLRRSSCCLGRAKMVKGTENGAVT